MTWYDHLGLSPSCTPAEIRRAYQTRCAGLEQTRRTLRTPAQRARLEMEARTVHAAYDILSHPTRRRAYDQQLKLPTSIDVPTPQHRKVSPLLASLLVIGVTGLIVAWQSPWLWAIWLACWGMAASVWWMQTAARRP